jgi:hypothetical protein
VSDVPEERNERSLLVLPLVGLAMLVLCASLMAIAYRQHQELLALRARAASRTGQADLGHGTTRSDSNETTQEMLEAIVAEGGLDLGAVTADAKARGERVVGAQVTRAQTPGLHVEALPSSGSERLPADVRPVGVVDPYGDLATRQRLDLAEPLGNGTAAPWGRVGFASALREPWSLDVHSRKYTATTVLTLGEDGKRTGYASLSVEVDGKKYALPIAESLYREVLPGARFRFSPTVFLGVGAGVSVRPSVRAELEPELGVGLFSYGTTKVLPTWSFLSLGIAWQGVSGLPAAVHTPAAWNAGEPLPLFDNLYLGPSVALDIHGGVTLLASIRALL